ncbi:Diacylglycerol O-acyltransferase protein [Dioscorea alata]|uniref:Diacylglycerol O-acyltransferase protein n=1 Tax=Dioscorea alata TaxID=55571 RepID=A0ACB7VPP2_DIOAL|nr:Diacylglycerol O-acyltransferase protein [Dioscorea alata]
MIEVCMGGKCKKSGALEVKEKFEKKVSIEGAVVGCKCMGKCRDGPNARLVNLSNKEDDLVRPLTNPLCLGVGLEDVKSIVSNFLGEKDANLLAA